MKYFSVLLRLLCVLTIVSGAPAPNEEKEETTAATPTEATDAGVSESASEPDVKKDDGSTGSSKIDPVELVQKIVNLIKKQAGSSITASSFVSGPVEAAPVAAGVAGAEAVADEIPAGSTLPAVACCGGCLVGVDGSFLPSVDAADLFRRKKFSPPFLLPDLDDLVDGGASGAPGVSVAGAPDATESPFTEGLSDPPVPACGDWFDVLVAPLVLALGLLLFDERNIGKKLCPEELFVGSFTGTGAGVAPGAAFAVGDVCGTVGEEDVAVGVPFALASVLGSVSPFNLPPPPPLPPPLLLEDSFRLSVSFASCSSVVAVLHPFTPLLEGVMPPLVVPSAPLPPSEVAEICSILLTLPTFMPPYSGIGASGLSGLAIRVQLSTLMNTSFPSIVRSLMHMCGCGGFLNVLDARDRRPSAATTHIVAVL
uniref:Uncharacterized protein n=1 Tax=Anopheles dirus TaxID=7168 RepID=A0A182NJ02_9DIPT